MEWCQPASCQRPDFNHLAGTLNKYLTRSKSLANGLGLLTNGTGTTRTLGERFVMQTEGPLFIFIYQPSICISTAKPKQGMVCYLNLSCPSDILVRALSTAQYMHQKHKNVLPPQHHKVNSLTKSQNASIQHTFERRWEGKTIHMSSRLGICILQALLKNKVILSRRAKVLPRCHSALSQKNEQHLVIQHLAKRHLLVESRKRDENWAGC